MIKHIEVKKRDGSIVPFDNSKIRHAIIRAMMDVDGTLYETDTATDIADEIEPHIWMGFEKHKYVLFKKDNKIGIIDAAQYKVLYPAIYDNIKWRLPNETFDAIENGETKTISIK